MKSQSPVNFPVLFKAPKVYWYQPPLQHCPHKCAGDPGFIIIYTRNTWDQTQVTSCLFWNLFVSRLYLLSLASIMKLGWILGMLSYGNLAKMSLSPHSQPTSLFWLTHSFEIVLLKGTQNFPLVNVCVCVCVGGHGGGHPAISISLYFNPKYYNATTYWSLEVFCRVLKKPIQSCTGKAKDSNHRLERKTRMLQICPRPKEP